MTFSNVVYIRMVWGKTFLGGKGECVCGGGVLLPQGAGFLLHVWGKRPGCQKLFSTVVSLSSL